MPGSQEEEAASLRDEEEVEEEEFEDEEAEVEEEAEAVVDVDDAAAAAEAAQNAEKDAAADASANSKAGLDVDTANFTELTLEASMVTETENAWKLFISSAESREAAGEAIYAALFESAPSLQSLFVTPRAVQAMRFMNGLANFVGFLQDPKGLKIQVETLGFGHLHLEVTVPRVVIFRDAIMDLFAVELGSRFNVQAEKGLRRMLNYVGGAIIFIKANYAERIQVLLASWKIATMAEEEKEKEHAEGQAAEQKDGAADKKKKGVSSLMGKAKGKDSEGEEGAGAEGKGQSDKNSAQNVPRTYDEMFKFNSAVMGFGNNLWLNEVLAVFGNIVTNVSNSARLQEECDVLGLRISRVTTGTVNLAEYKSCMLASLRSLLPKDWSTAHEVAWSWLWENVERLLQRNMGKPVRYERALAKLLASIDEQQKFGLRAAIYARFFELCPPGQDYFKQSNTYLHVIADRVIDMTMEFYRTPVKLVDDISALGLRHVGYGIPTEYMSPFVTACVEVVQTATKDDEAVESFGWSLSLVLKILVRTVTEGSTIVMKAINVNNVKSLKKAIGCAPRGERMAWMLLVQVGTQDISPLFWSIKAGALESSETMIKDILTVRADRDKYYYGTDDLFHRHPDIIKICSDEAPILLPPLLDGLIWRSKLTESGLRRVNYFIKHMLVDVNGNFAQPLEWIAKSKDPKIVCHPVLVLLADLVWSGVASTAFFWRKAWFLFTLIIFIVSQSLLENIGGHHKEFSQRAAIFSCRLFIYTCSLMGLLSTHGNKIYTAVRTKDVSKVFGIIPVPRYLFVWADAFSFMLTVCLVLMLTLEPIFHCWGSGELFEEECDASEGTIFTYSLIGMFAMFIYFVLLMVLAVFNMTVSAYVLVCQRMVSEVGLFLFALACAIFMTAAAATVLDQTHEDFHGINQGSLSLLKMFMRMYITDHYVGMMRDPVLFICAALFLVLSTVFLLNMLIAQLTCAYQAVYVDMVGFARLERIEIIVETMRLVSAKRWQRFVDTLRFDERIEFNPGDIGLMGGIQVMEPAGANPTTIDMIHRYGGSTSPSIQWPEDEEGDGDEDDRWERLEGLLNKTLKKLAKSGGGAKKKGGGKSSSGMGSSGKGGTSSGAGASSGEGGGGDDGEDEGED